LQHYFEEHCANKW